jgi:hypothetical protein
MAVDCGGTGQEWGCGCPRCRDRTHPLDLMARLTREQLDELSARRPQAPVNKGTCYCGAPGRLTGGGWRCPDHWQQAALMSQETKLAIHRYAKNPDSDPWPSAQSLRPAPAPPKVRKKRGRRTVEDRSGGRQGAR